MYQHNVIASRDKKLKQLGLENTPASRSTAMRAYSSVVADAPTKTVVTFDTSSNVTSSFEGTTTSGPPDSSTPLQVNVSFWASGMLLLLLRSSENSVLRAGILAVTKEEFDHYDISTGSPLVTIQQPPDTSWLRLAEGVTGHGPVAGVHVVQVEEDAVGRELERLGRRGGQGRRRLGVQVGADAADAADVDEGARLQQRRGELH
ncbi:hypothetical protein ON010_g15046 [Phytophthora cinnamomi]|nr:hypothetical protein ON010_g15046 [Phytophthora cinnamomi]